jgi:hypothetical protein
MIRGAHVITNLTTGGAEMMFYRMLQVMDRSRFEAEVFSLKQNHPVGDKIAELGEHGPRASWKVCGAKLKSPLFRPTM